MGNDVVGIYLLEQRWQQGYRVTNKISHEAADHKHEVALQKISESIGH